MYSVEDEIITVTVIGVEKRENDAVYKVTRHRSQSLRKYSLSVKRYDKQAQFPYVTAPDICHVYETMAYVVYA